MGAHCIEVDAEYGQKFHEKIIKKKMAMDSFYTERLGDCSNSKM
jgi:hypothetical protein